MKQLLNEAIEDYMRHRQSKKLSPHTLRRERMVLRRFMTVNGNIYLWSVKDSHVDRYMLDAGETRPRSLHLDINTLKHFFAWARHTKRMALSNDPLWGREAPKLEKEEKRRVPARNFEHLLKAAGQAHPRDRILVAVGLFLMLRASEIKTLKVGDLDLDSGHIRVHIHKTKKFDLAPIRPRLDKEFRAWLTYYTQQCGVPHPDWYLVPAMWGHRPRQNKETKLLEKGDVGLVRPYRAMTQPEQNIQRALVRIGFTVRDPETGQSLREGEHTLRRSGARALYEELKAEGLSDPLEVVQHMLNHASRKQTEEYIGVTSSRETRDTVIRSLDRYTATTDNIIELDGGRRWEQIAVREQASRRV